MPENKKNSGIVLFNHILGSFDSVNIDRGIITVEYSGIIDGKIFDKEIAFDKKHKLFILVLDGGE